MAVNITVPSFGESVTEGTIAQWLKKTGTAVQQDEIILEIESEKATQGIPAPASGILKIDKKEGDRVEVGSIIGSIDESAAPAKATTEPVAATVQDEKPAKVLKAAGPNRLVLVDSPPTQSAPTKAAETAKPAAIKEPRPSEMPPISTDRDKRVPMSAIRQRIAERLLASQKATASLTTFNEADMSAIMELRSHFKDVFKEKHGANLGFLSFFVKASIEALKAFPLVNASIDGRDLVYHNYFNIGVAVSTDKGLMVPVLRDAEKMSFAQIEQAVADLAVKARDGKINVADLQGGTFTITNGGIFGSMMSTPILNYPQAAILGMHTIQKRPVVRDDAIVIRPMMYLALTYDHRLIDGREAVLFLVRIKEFLEAPQRLLLDA